MAATKITSLTSISTVDTALDPIPIVDVSDTSQSASGTTKKVTVDQIESSIFGSTGSKAIVVDNVAALKALTVASVDDGQLFLTRGYYSDNDGGQGTYVYDAASSTADNGGTVIAPTTGSGRYLLQYSGVLNVKQFGAKGDNATDDTSKIASALAAVGSGATVYLPSGTYIVNGSTLLPASNTTIKGDGYSTVIKRTVSTSPLFQIPASSLFSGIRFSDISFSGPSSNYPSSLATAIQILENGSTGTSISGCTFEKWVIAIDVRKSNPDLIVDSCIGSKNAGTLILSEAGIRHKIINCSSSGDRTGVGDGSRGRVGIWLSDPGDGSASGYGCVVSGCSVNGFLNEGIIVRTATSVVSDCYVDDCTDGASGTYGIIIEDTAGTSNIGQFGIGAGNYCTIDSCIVKGCDGGIRMSFDPANINSTPNDGVCSNNQIFNCLGSSTKGISIGIAGASKFPLRMIVNGNKVYNQSGAGNCDGIYLFGVKSGLVSGNLISNVTRYGIILDTSASGGTEQVVNVSVSGNIITSALSSGIYLYPRAASSIYRCSVVANTITLPAATSGSGIMVDSTVTGGLVETSFVSNVVQGSTTNTGYGLLLNGTNLQASGNVGTCIFMRVLDTNGTTTWRDNGGVNDANRRKVFFDTAAPSSTVIDANVGDICWNLAPATAGYVGWVCTVAGTPGSSAGTWKGFGVVA